MNEVDCSAFEHNKKSDIRNIGRSDTPYFKYKGEYTIGWNCVIDISGGITIGEEVTISRNTTIYTHKHDVSKLDWYGNKDHVSYNGLVIEDKAYIGTGSIILPQVNRIGYRAVIGAGSVVTKNVPDFEIWAGNPAKKIGVIDSV